MAIEQDIDKILESGLEAISRTNNGSYSDAVTHVSIVGGVRRVEWYPTKGTVYVNAQDEFKVFKQKHTTVDVAIRVAKQGE